MSYRIFLDSFLLPFKVGEGHAIEAMNTAIKSDRQKLKRLFTESGQPGDMFRSLFAFESITGRLVVVFIVMVVWHVHQKPCCCCHCGDHRLPLMFLIFGLQFIVVVCLDLQAPHHTCRRSISTKLPVTCPVITTDFGYIGNKSQAEHTKT